jgi:putative restriction endonuclease
MKTREQYSKYMQEKNLEGSNKASSYIRALELQDEILKRHPLFGQRDFWSIESIDAIGQLYEYALEHQKKEGGEFLQPDLPPSYGRNGYYSAALKSYQEFLILRQYEDGLWEVYNTPELDAAELGRRLARKKIKSIEALVSDRDIDFSTKEGKEVLRQTKARVNQDFFRDMILLDYGAQCCVTGLNVPGVLRASHIVAWKDDKPNRLNPANGLCLSATYDAAFDRHLISFDEDYRMIFSPQLKEYYTNEAFKTQFRAFEGKRISLPKRYCPDQAFLEKNRQKLCA